jgi:hypothetical protein
VNGSIRLFAPLQKVADADDDDGSLTVSGFASSEAVDAQGEVVTSAAMKAAIPSFMAGGTGALREMHAAIAAGIVTKLSVDTKGRTEITAKVIDNGTMRKLRAGVFRGFSVGGKILARDAKNPKTITKIRLDEVSLVDKPSNSEATLELIKVVGPTPTVKTAPTLVVDDRFKAVINKALGTMTEEDRVLLLIKATHQLPHAAI